MIITNTESISVVICSKDRISDLRKCLKSLTKQRDKNFNVVIVDTGTDVRMSSLISKYQKFLHINIISSNKHNLTYARNLGINHSNRNIVAFVDDDAVVDRDWVAHIYSFFQQRPEAVVVGGKIHSLKKDYISEFSERLFNFGLKRRPVPVIMGVNMAIHLRRFYSLHVSDRYKIFDENIIDDTGDDTEMCYFVWSKGGTVWYDPDIIVSHEIRNNIFDFLLRHFQYAQGDCHVMLLPEYRDRSLIDDYFPTVKRQSYKAFIPLLILSAVVHKSIKFALANGLKWLPIIIVRELVYLCGLYNFYLYQHNGVRHRKK